MEKKFDLRRQSDREELAGFLPSFDSRTIDVPSPVFVDALRDVSAFLGGPDWLTYQWGIVGPFHDQTSQHPLELARIVQLGLDLSEVSGYEDFEAILAGFRNPPQILDTMFEVRTAAFFSRLISTKRLRFAPEYKVRGQQKRPEFDVINDLGVFSVECKRPHLHVQRAAETFHRLADAVHEALKAVGWPRDARLEIEITNPLREQPASFARRVAESGLTAWHGGETQFAEKSAKVFVAPRDSQFCISDPRCGHDVMLLDTDEATGLFNPKMTMLRIANDGLYHRFARSVGARIAEALRQLPVQHGGIIVLGEVPRRVADSAIARRIQDPAYNQVVAFVVAEEGDFHFSFRTENQDLIQKIVSAGQRPPFTVT
jgi:hypothetical protein